SEREGVLTVSRLDLMREYKIGLMRVVQFPEKGPTLFSDLVDLKRHVENPISLDLTLKPGVRVAGRLDSQVPRPVKNGRVVAGVRTGHLDSPNNWRWDATATVASDGTFVFESLPPDENLQLFAVCDGWVSTSPSRDEALKYAEADRFEVVYPGPLDWAVSPHVYRLNGAAIEPVVPMQRAAKCEVRVTDEANKPIAGARVAFNANQKWLNGEATFLGAGVDSVSVMRRQLASGVHTAKATFDRFSEPFVARTDARGMALVQNLPALVTDELVAPSRGASITVTCKGYLQMSKQMERPALSVVLAPGETSNVTVHLKKE
ncbi:MAG TPA: hypothetical protein VHX68_16640, partial [Planctomycetaceae bacterium]|nr:hypothetical protein [Planctomycetaceae bacterium]